MEEWQLICDHSMKNDNDKSVLDVPLSVNEPTMAIIARDSRSNERRHELLQVEKANKLKHIKEKTSSSLKPLHDSFPKINID